MTPPASRPLLRSVDHGKRIVFQLEPLYGRPECVLECEQFTVRRAATARDRAGTSHLLNEMYSRRGYDTADVIRLPRRENSITLDAINDDDVVGTVTVRMDAGGTGLLADALYNSEINAFRIAGRRVCEVCKLAIDPSRNSKELMAALFQLAYLYAHVINRATDAFIEVNPRHVGFYKRMLGFREAGDMRMCTRVNAPAVLLHVELSYMQAQIARHGGCGEYSTEKSLYPYFTNCRAEDSIHRAARTRARRHH